MHRGEVSVGGVRFSYLERAAAEKRSKPAIVLLHGLIASAATFEPLVAELPPDRRVVALDLPVRTDRASGVSFAALAELITRFCSAVQVTRPVLLGHSHGGALALAMAAHHPGFARGLILIAPAHPFSGTERQVVRFYLSPAGRIVAHLLPCLPPWMQWIGVRQMTGPRSCMSAEQVEPYRKALRTTGNVSQVLRILRTWQQDMDRLAERLRQHPIVTPTLLIWGADDGVVPANTASGLARHIVECKQAMLPGIGHLPSEEAPAECGAIIRSWLISLEAQEECRPMGEPGYRSGVSPNSS